MAELEKPISKMIVKDLKVELQKRGLDTKGLKADLVKRLEEALAGTKENGGEEVEEAATEEKEEEVEEEKPKRGQKRRSSRGTPKTERKKKEVEPKPKSSPKRARKGDKGNEEGEEEGEKEEMAVEEKKEEEKKEEKAVEKKEEKSAPVEKKEEEKKPVEKKEEKAPEKKEEKSAPVKEENKKAAPQKKEEEKPVEEKKAPQKKEETKAAPESKGSPGSSGDTSSPATSRRQRRWGPSSNSDVGSISTDTIKEILTVPPEPAPAPVTAAAPKRKREEPEATAETPKKEAAPLAKTPAKVQKKDEEAKPEVREVPPSKKPVSNVLLITHFVRPFTKQAVEELLSQTGKVVEWGMDQIKSRCFVIYETEQEAEATRSALHNLCWPPTNKTKLQVDFSTETEAKRAVNRGTEKPRTKTPPPQEKALTLDDLFRKTAAKPHIYYLPLTDSEVEEKRKTGQQPTNGASQSQNQEK